MRILETERLILRTWRSADAEPFFHINQDPNVLEFLPSSMSMKQVQQFIAHTNKQQTTLGYTLWAAELKATNELLGWVGLNYVDWPNIHFTPAVEIGWRLGAAFWGFGYATEAAKACLAYGFQYCHFKEIVAFTVPENQRSRHVMERIGMVQDVQGNFAHPNLSANHRLSTHVLYRIAKDF